MPDFMKLVKFRREIAPLLAPKSKSHVSKYTDKKTITEALNHMVDGVSIQEKYGVCVNSFHRSVSETDSEAVAMILDAETGDILVESAYRYTRYVEMSHDSYIDQMFADIVAKDKEAKSSMQLANLTNAIKQSDDTQKLRKSSAWLKYTGFLSWQIRLALLDVLGGFAPDDGEIDDKLVTRQASLPQKTVESVQIAESARLDPPVEPVKLDPNRLVKQSVSVDDPFTSTPKPSPINNNRIFSAFQRFNNNKPLEDIQIQDLLKANEKTLNDIDPDWKSKSHTENIATFVQLSRSTPEIPNSFYN